ncbi:DUF58 domain-containing protein [Marinicella rhabdoformis]|uniref:DUF58 domain-containing protein n=1 Tax=Marinicella rhabdoformis TaxID=2580566 RepID=UPI0012AED844|nr:DUF58 domain-containing protein [Marinicella rhabdoformis]
MSQNAKKEATKGQNPAIDVMAKTMVNTRHHARQLGMARMKKASSAISGLHDSRFRGRGMDYLESRIYQAGDDIRNMDWRVTARTGDAHTKLFQEERERPTYVILDSNASMFFGTKSKFKMVLASEIAAFFGWSSIQNGDRIGVLTYGIHGTHIVKATPGKRGMMAMMSHVLKTSVRIPKVENKAEQQENLDQALKQMRTVIRPGSLVFIVSDFLNLGEEAKRQLLQLRKHNDVLAVKVADPFEVESPLAARYGIQTQSRQQSDRHMKVRIMDTRKDATLERLNTQQQNHIEDLKTQIIKAGVPIIPVQTNDLWVNKLRNGLSNPSLAFNHWLGKQS